MSDDAADIEVEDGAEDVVDEDGDQQQPAADERADDEDEVLDRDVDHRRPRPPSSGASASGGQDSDRRARARGCRPRRADGSAGRAEQDGQPALERATRSLRRRAGRPPNPARRRRSGGASGASVNGDLVRAAEAVGRAPAAR